MSDITLQSTLDRDQFGLLKGVEYPRRVDGSVDWRRLVPAEFLAIKREYEEQAVTLTGKPLAEIDKTQLPDNYLLLLLGGIKRLLLLRGYRSAIPHVDYIGDGKAVVSWTIQFIGNYETWMQPVVYGEVASATYANTSGDIAQMFLETTASNRAFVRCVRNFLNINIVGSDEMGPSKRAKSEAPAEATPVAAAQEGQTPIPGFNAQAYLARLCQESKISLGQMKATAAAYKGELKGAPESWTAFQDVGDLDAYVIAGKIKKKQDEIVAVGGKKK